MRAINQLPRFVVGAMLTAFVMAGIGMSAASAQQSGTPTAAAFLANPGQLLQQNPNGGSLLTNAVQQTPGSPVSTPTFTFTSSTSGASSVPGGTTSGITSVVSLSQ